MSTTDAGRADTFLRTGFIAYFAGNRVAANLLMALLVFTGVLSAIHLPVQNFPDLDFRAVSVSVRSPGSSPRELEEDIVRRVEEAVLGLSGVERVVSTATHGLGRVSVEMADFADAGTVLDDVVRAVDGIESFPPLGAERPEVELFRLDLEVMTMAVSSSVAGENELRLAAEELRDGLLGLPSISLVTLEGTRDREISIELSEEELRRNDLTINRVANAVRRASLNLTFGELRTEAGGVVLHTVGKRRAGKEFEDIPLITRLDGTIVTLGDIAEVRDGFVDEDVVSRFDGRPAVFVRVDAAEGQSIVDIADEMRAWLSTWEAPQDITIEIWNDRVSPIFDRFSSIVRNGVIGAVLVFICLVLVFDLRVAFWVTLGIPLSLVGSLLFFGPANLTLNMGTLFAFFLLIGVVVDDAVVVGESIAAERERGKSALAAAVSGARSVVGPITVGVLTTILAFLPLLFVTAGSYQIVNVFPWVALFVLLISLVEAFFILPAHLSHERRWSAPPLSDVQDWVRAWLDEIRDRIVVPAVSWSVRNTWLTLAVAVAVVLVSLVLIRSEAVRVVVFDRDLDAPDNIQADLHLPAGTPFEVTVAAAELRSLMETVPGVYGVADSLQPGKRHFQITLTPAGKAAGLTPALVGRQLRANFHGVSVQRLQRGHEELKVMVRYPAERRRSLRELASERIHRPGGGEVPLSMVAEITEKRELATLTRIDGRRAARVHARADTAVVTPIQARRAIREQFIPGLLAKYPGIRIEADGGERRERAMLGTLSVLVPIALIAIFALMAAFLRSYWKPIIAVAGIPTAFAGAVLGHWVLGWDFTAMSMFGVIAVAGVVVNDALVLLDRYNTMRRENPMLPAIAAAAAATRHRFRAVFLTSLTTVLGLSPMLYDRSDALINLVPLVVSMWGGLVLATLFVLFCCRRW